MKKRILITIIILALIGTIIYYYFAAKIEYSNNIYVQEKVNSASYGELYSYYFQQKLLTNERPIVGLESSPLMFSVIVDFYSENMKSFFDNRLDWMKLSYVDTGDAKINFKYYITQEEYEQKKGRFIYAFISHCYTELGGKDLYGFTYDLILADKDNLEDMLSVAEKHGYSKGLMSACMTKTPPGNIYEDSLESELYRFVAPSVQISIEGEGSIAIYPGTSFNAINTTIRSKQISIGI